MPIQTIKKQLGKLSIEEVANTLTHGFGLLLSIFGLILLSALATVYGDFWHITSCAIYGSSLVILYAASTLYHIASSPELKAKLQLVDHCCIYLLIAGTYTPFVLVALRGTLGNTIFILVWAFAIAGIIFKIIFHKRFRAASLVSYLLMGWLGVFAVEPLFAKLGFAAIALVVAGGIVYSLGTIFYGWHSLKHHHALWHVCVLGGSVCHFLAISIYVMPQVVSF